MSSDMDQIRYPRASISHNLLLQSFSCNQTSNMLIQTLSVLLQKLELMAGKNTASFNRLTCTDYVDFGKSQNRFGQFFWSRRHFNYLNANLKVVNLDYNTYFNLIQSKAMRNRISIEVRGSNSK